MGGKKRNIRASQNILQLYSGLDNKPIDVNKDEKKKKKNRKKKMIKKVKGHKE